MILHLLTDDKFSDYVISQFSGPEMCSEFVLMSGSEVTCYFQDVDKVMRVNPYEKGEMASLIVSLKNYSAIILHGLFYPWCEMILRSVPDNVKVAWEFWGGEIYGREDLTDVFKAPLTRFVDKIHAMKNRQSYSSWQLPMYLFQRIDYCLTAQQEEYEFAKAYFGSSKLKHLWYTYYSIEETVGDLIDTRSEGENMWFCHNAFVESNAFDALIKLSLFYKKHLKGRSVIMPLSYGNPWVKKTMNRLGPHLFDDFAPLTAFLPRPDYNRLMLSCSTMVLPCYRPAGQGNVLTALWLGMRVYLSEHSISFNYFKRIGLIIFSFESDFRVLGCQKLSEKEVIHNRNVLSTHFSHDSIKKACITLVGILNG
jgi:hypothetical protein